MKIIYRASILYGYNVVKDKYFDSYEKALSWCHYELDVFRKFHPDFVDWYEAVIIEVEGVIL